ncbi:MAG TPA: phenylalanine--tRNA ligase subunit alpha [Deltaproteobacteria bacterium]|nr:phenylalanine--tRNA ligase subunit alpha [Deltaproteobacteria bacterium]
MKDSLLQRLESLREDFSKSLTQVSGEHSLQELKSEYLGKKGRLTEVLKEMGRLSAADRPAVGAKSNEVKEHIEARIAEALQQAKSQAIEAELARDRFDPTLPGRPEILGHLHPVTQVMKQCRDIFERLGFVTATGPEIEDEYHNFEALNIPEAHPARDLQDTFYLQGKTWLLRTHTSPVQIRQLARQKPPLRMIAPGAVYRCDSDVTHSPMFHQIEGLWVDEKITFADLKGVLARFVKDLFGDALQVRFRPSFFPFTEPSAELDMTCFSCQGKGCHLCKGTGWIEVLGCGMVDPSVFGFVGVDPEKYSGFAFGIGMERLAMLKFGITDLRLLFENDVRFLKQF